MKQNFGKVLLSFVQTFIGTAFIAAAFGAILVPQGFAAGGITGLARMLGIVLPIPLSALVFLLTVPIFLIGLLSMGWEFIGKTLASSLLFPMLLELFSHIAFPVIGISGNILAAGLFLGTGSLFLLHSNASSGGFDTLAVAVHRKLGVPVASTIRFCDATVILLQAMEQPLKSTVAGILVILISTAVIRCFFQTSPRRSFPLPQNRQLRTVKY